MKERGSIWVLIPPLLIVLALLAAAWMPQPLSTVDELATSAPETTAPAAAASNAMRRAVEITPISTPTARPTATPKPTASPTPLPTATATLTPLPTATVTFTASPISPLATPTLPPTPTALPTPTYPPPPEAVHVPILMYHYISPLPANADVYRRNLTVAPELFEAQLQYLPEQGYQTVTLFDVYDALATGRPLPEKPIVLTFDDGYKDAYTDALPLLQKYGYVGIFFLLATPAHYEAPNYMTWTDVQAMADVGMSMQAHGRDHHDLRDRDNEFLVYQILGAKEAVEAHSNQPVRFFCYPSGRYDDDVLAVVESAGYLGAVTTEWGATQRLDNRYTWPRIRVNGEWSLAQFTKVLRELEE